MIGIRTYLAGDEAKLVEIFNRSFPGGIVRTEASWLWRFADNPYFDPEGVIVAEENGEIVGYLIGTVRRLLFKGQMAAAVVGDDFCLSPEARGKGIGKMLLNRLMSFAEEKRALIMVYEGKDNLAHKMCIRLGWSTVDEFVIMRRVGGASPGSSIGIEQNQTFESCRGQVVRRCLEKDIDRVVDFLNLANREKMGAPQLNKSEYEWRYLTYTNSSLDSVLLAEECGNIVGHVAVTFHRISGDQQQMVILSEPSGKIQGALESLRELKAPGVNVALDIENFVHYESSGFSPVARGVVVVKNYSDLDIFRSGAEAEWYLFSESIFGEP